MRLNHLAAVFVLVFIAAILASMAWATPDGVTITPISNSTSTPEAGGLINTTGGSITVINLNGTTQNVRWKAFVGNVSGKLILDDATGNTIYDWTLTAFTGEVYATRHSATVNWSGINCAGLNATDMESINLSHTNVDDNITATFNGMDNREMFVGTVRISQNTCRTTNLFQNSTDPGATTDDFEEIVLHDRGNASLNIGNTTSFGRIVYAQTLEQNALGFDNRTMYDFQMIVPERGEAAWASSTAYYLYIELS